jgi:hypothetical protein
MFSIRTRPWRFLLALVFAQALAWAVVAVETVNRSIGGNTAIGSISAFAAARLEDNGFEGRRLVIDISGDPVLVVRRKTATRYDYMDVGPEPRPDVHDNLPLPPKFPQSPILI